MEWNVALFMCEAILALLATMNKLAQMKNDILYEITRSSDNKLTDFPTISDMRLQVRPINIH